MATAADHTAALRTAKHAGRLLTDLRAGLGPSEPEVLRSEGDRRSHELIVSELSAMFPGDAILSEEGVDNSDRIRSDRVWVVDPLDGTREFGEGRADFAVHVALVEAGVPVVGAVAL
ncbi:MAG: inositol monophosphatase family protein, partial [Acidimicrobiales bacterium]